MNELAIWVGRIIEMLSLEDADKIEKEFIRHGDKKTVAVKAYRVGNNVIQIDIKY